MIKHSILLNIFFGVLIFLLSGCGRILDWGACIFDQGTELTDIACKAHIYIRTTKVYDEFTTVGLFDALWLNDAVKNTYADLYTFRRGKNEDFKNVFLRRQLEENKHYLLFYVLSPFELTLLDDQSKWIPFLDIDGIIYHPSEIKIIELDPEYKAIFRNKVSRFKETYGIKFSAYDKDDNPIVTPTTSIIKLYFRSVDKETFVLWKLDEIVKADCKCIETH